MAAGVSFIVDPLKQVGEAGVRPGGNSEVEGQVIFFVVSDRGIVGILDTKPISRQCAQSKKISRGLILGDHSPGIVGNQP